MTESVHDDAVDFDESTRCKVSLRPAVALDREFLYQLHKRAMGSQVEALFGPWEDRVQLELFDRWFEDSKVYIVTSEQFDVGVLALIESQDEIYVSRIEIDPDHQNRGIGTAVLRGVFTQARTTARTVSLHVFAGNPASEIYRRLGFIQSKEQDDRIRMTALSGGVG